MEPLGIFLTLFALAAFVMVLLVINRVRSQSNPGIVDASMLAESVRVDLAVLKANPLLAPAVEGVKWSKVEKQYGGRTVVGGVVVFGPKRLTWAPDERARQVGVQPWQVAWDDMTGVAVRTATETTSAALLVTLGDGTPLELAGVNEQAALAAVSRRSESH